MKVATSRYFAKRVVDESGLTPIGFTRGWPKFGVSVDVVANLRALGPVGDMFGMDDRDEFAVAYKAHLDSIGVERIEDLLEAVGSLGWPNGEPLIDAPEEGVVLLCFCDLEKDDATWCHRQVFAEWWHERTGETVEELAPAQVELEARS